MIHGNVLDTNYYARYFSHGIGVESKSEKFFSVPAQNFVIDFGIFGSPIFSFGFAIEMPCPEAHRKTDIRKRHSRPPDGAIRI